MNDINQVSDRIKEVIENAHKEKREKRREILTYLSDLCVKVEYQSLSDTEFFDIIGECLKLNPEFFMNSLYRDIRNIAIRQFGEEGRRIMEKYILETFCLYDREQILYTCEGRVQQTRKGKGVRIYGTLYVTNKKIIAQGKIQKINVSNPIISYYLQNPISTSRKMRKIKKIVVERSVKQELPCYGYQFPYQNLLFLRTKGKKIKYTMSLDNLPYDFIINSTSFKNKEKRDYFIEILEHEPGQLIDKKVFEDRGKTNPYTIPNSL